MTFDPTDYYDPNFDPNDPGWDEDDTPEDVDPPPDDGDKLCVPTDCELVEVEDGWCCYVCAASCDDGSMITEVFCDDCDGGSE